MEGMTMKWYIKLKARESWKEYVTLPGYETQAEAMEVRDLCLGEIAIAKPGSLAYCWYDVAVVPEGWPEITHWDVIRQDCEEGRLATKVVE